MRSCIRLSVVAVLAVSGAASASITGTTGPVEIISAPAFVSPGTDYATFIGDATVWNEQQNVAMSGVAVDMVNNAGSSLSPTAGTLTGTYDSHFFHFRQSTGASVQGTITFSGFIVGVAFDTPTLNGSDAIVAPFGTTYNTSFPRGIMSPIENFSILGNVLTFDVVGFPAPNMDTAQFRVFTEAVPAPGSMALAAAGGLFMGRRRRRSA